MIRDRDADSMTQAATRAVRTSLGAAMFLSTCIVFMVTLLLRHYDDAAETDPSLYALIGHELLGGRQLYSDLWDHKPPAIYLIYAATELVVGYGPQQFYFLNVAAWTLGLLGLYHAGKILGGPPAGLCAGTLWTILVILPEWFSQPNTEVFVNVALIWSCCILLRMSITPSRWLACLFGACVGAASLFKHVAIAPAALLALGYIIGSRRTEGGPRLALWHMLMAAAASSLPWLVCIGWFWIRGTLGDFYDAVFVFNRYYSGDWASNLTRIFESDHEAHLLVIVLVCALVQYAPGAQANRTQRMGWLMLAGWAVGCEIAIALPGRWLRHYFQVWLPVYALAGGLVLTLPLSGAFVQRGVWRLGFLAAVFAPLVSTHAYDPGPPARYVENRLDCKLAADAIDRELFPEETVFVLGGLAETSGVYFAIRRSPPSGVFSFYHFRRGPLAAILEARMLRDLDRARPDLIVLSRDQFQPAIDREPGARGQRLVDWIVERYAPRSLDAPAKYKFYVRRGADLERRPLKARAETWLAPSARSCRPAVGLPLDKRWHMPSLAFVSRCHAI